MKFLYSLLLPLMVGGLAGWTTAENVRTWYPLLKKPSFNPPDWLFAPVWTLIYILMGIALYRVWRKPGSGQRNKALFLFFFQLLLNGCWSFIFFYFHQVGWALADISVLWVLILVTMIWFARIDKTAALLLAPYIAWVSFATLLNFSIWTLNS